MECPSSQGEAQPVGGRAIQGEAEPAMEWAGAEAAGSWAMVVEYVCAVVGVYVKRKYINTMMKLSKMYFLIWYKNMVNVLKNK